MYNRYISLLLEYSSAFFVMVNLFWNSIFLHYKLKLSLEIEVVNAPVSTASVAQVGLSSHIQPFSIQ
jgi:hypothetical protein